MILVAGYTLGTTLSRIFPLEFVMVRDAINTVIQILVKKLGRCLESGHLQRLWSRRTNAPPSSVRLLTFPILESLGLETELRLADTWRFRSRLRPPPTHAIIYEVSSFISIHGCWLVVVQWRRWWLYWISLNNFRSNGDAWADLGSLCDTMCRTTSQ